MTQNKQKIDQLLNKDVQGEQPDPGWKLELIKTMDKETARLKQAGGSKIKSKKRPFIFAASGILVITLIAIVVTQKDVLLDSVENFPEGSYSAWHIDIAGDWELEHVSYEFAENLEWERYVQRYYRTSPSFNRDTTDEVALSINPKALSEPVTEEEKMIQYIIDDQTITFWLEEYGPYNDDLENERLIQYNIELFKAPEGKAFTKQDKIKLTNQEQQVITQQFVDDHLALLYSDDYHFKKTVYPGMDTEAIVEVIDENYSYDSLNAHFYNGELYTVHGYLIDSVTKKETMDYGKSKDVMNFLNYNPSFPIHNPDFPDVEVRYLITDLRQTPEGLEIKQELQNPRATLKALGIEGTFSGEAEIVQNYQPLLTREEQKQRMDEIDAIRKTIEESEE